MISKVPGMGIIWKQIQIEIFLKFLTLSSNLQFQMIWLDSIWDEERFEENLN